jgi:hypothetical protein
MIINGFSLENDEKIDRAIHGTVTEKGQLTGGVGEGASEEAILAEYDRLGGLITKEGEKVKNGSFYDYQGKKAREKADVMFVAEIDGDLVDVTEEEAKAIKVAKKKSSEIKKKLKKSNKIE